MTENRRRAVWLLVAAGLPALILFWASYCFVWNHFYVDGPYLQDAGWYSAIIYRQGIVPKNFPVAFGVTSYFEVHVSLLVSIASIVSYVFPIDRVDYYCLFQGLIYAPLAIAPALLVPKKERRTIKGALAVALPAIAFSFGGQVLACVGYPHYEIFIPVGVCIMLAGFGSGRRGVAWLGILLACITREDGGLHAALFIGAVLASDFLGRPFPIPRRTVITMGIVAIAASSFAMFAQKYWFHGGGLFRAEYLGTPMYVHMTTATIAKRAQDFFSQCRFIWFAIAATVAVSIARRDARYMLGWLAGFPWLFLNFAAAQDLKAVFSIYTGFPFVASIFWVGPYALVREHPSRRLRSALMFIAGTSIASTLGLWSSIPSAFVALTSRMSRPLETNPTQIRAFARSLRNDPSAYGKLLVDSSVASWAIDSIPIDAWTFDRATDAQLANHDAYAFFRTGLLGFRLVDLLARGGFDSCGMIPRTSVYFCAKPGHALPPFFEPRSLMLDLMSADGDIPPTRNSDGSFFIGATQVPGVRLFGPYAHLRAGKYLAAWNMTFAPCGRAPAPLAAFDVYENGHIFDRSVIAREETTTAMIEFEVTPDHDGEAFELRTSSGSCPFTLRDVTLVARP